MSERARSVNDCGMLVRSFETSRGTIEIIAEVVVEGRCLHLVHESQAWADVRARDDRFHDILEKAAKRGAAVPGDGSAVLAT